MLARNRLRGYSEGMKSFWILAAMVSVVGANAQQSTGGNAGSGGVGTVLPQVAPGLQQNNNNNNGGGISFVTRRTPTAVTANQARGFFAAGGVNLGGAAVGAGGGSVGGVDSSPITAGVERQPVVLPTEAELARLAAAAQRGDAKAQARLAEYRRALTAGNTAPVAVSSSRPAQASQNPSRPKPSEKKARTTVVKTGVPVK